MVKLLLFFRFRVINSRLKDGKFHFELLTRLVNFNFLTFELQTWSWEMKKPLKYYSLNVHEPLEINTPP